MLVKMKSLFLCHLRGYIAHMSFYTPVADLGGSDWGDRPPLREKIFDFS
jgi:hypothetical protein